MTHIDWHNLAGRYTYTEFREHMGQLLSEGKTTGPDQSPAMIHYTELNEARMRRLDKRSRVTEESMKALEDIKRPQVWLSLTEAWCGDAAQIVPVLEQLAEAHPLIDHYLILRDEHLDIMDAFLTNGARSIPITVVLDKETNEVLGHWGPRPSELQNKVMEAKAASLAAPTPEERREIREQAKVEAQKWYARDKTRSTQNEILQTVGAITGSDEA